MIQKHFIAEETILEIYLTSKSNIYNWTLPDHWWTILMLIF